jgi:hypothetical protein
MNNTPLPFIMQSDNLILMVDNVSYTINKHSHINYAKILEAIKEQRWDDAALLVDVTKSLTNYACGKLTIVNGTIFWDGREFHNSLAKRLLQMYEDGFEISPMVNFMENVMLNPSYRAVEELYGFLEKNQLPLTPDGHFLAYKKVKFVEEDNVDKGFFRGDFVDCHTGTMRNNVGDKPSMERNTVDDNANNTCSRGLHFASLEYLQHSGFGGNGPLLILKINPKDVVSIPIDYNNQKGRACTYEVLSVHTPGILKEAFTEVVQEQA